LKPPPPTAHLNIPRRLPMGFVPSARPNPVNTWVSLAMPPMELEIPLEKLWVYRFEG